jgi:Mrp family chromosome partitioning ATPase
MSLGTRFNANRSSDREASLLEPEAVQVTPGSNPLLDLHAALEELAHLQNGAHSGRVSRPVRPPRPPAPSPMHRLPGEVTEWGLARLIRISEGIEVLIEPERAAASLAETAVAAPIPELPAASRRSFDVFDPRCPANLADAFRKLRGRLVEEQERRRAAGAVLNSVAIVSARHSSGRSATARNLAACLGTSPDARVLLVDADAVKPSLHRRLSLPQSPGLAEALPAGPAWRGLAHRIPGSGLYVLTLGAAHTGIDSLDYRLLPAFLERVRAEFDWCVIDAPSMETADGEAVAGLADSALLVLRNERDYFDEADAVVRRLGPSHLLGAVLNFAA